MPLIVVILGKERLIVVMTHGALAGFCFICAFSKFEEDLSSRSTRMLN